MFSGRLHNSLYPSGPVRLRELYIGVMLRRSDKLSDTLVDMIFRLKRVNVDDRSEK